MGLRIKDPLGWPEDLDEARRYQASLARSVRLGDKFGMVAGVGLAYAHNETHAFVVASVLSTTNWRPVHEQQIVLPVSRSREPDMESFREGPLYVAVLERLAVEPDLILVEGHGIAHPRRFGVACYVGLTFDIPTVGVAQHWPSGCGTHPVQFQGGLRRGNISAIRHDPSGDRVGSEVCTQDHEEPLRVSPGHRVSVEDATSLVLRCSPWMRVPEPLRAAEAKALSMRDTGVP